MKGKGGEKEEGKKRGRVAGSTEETKERTETEGSRGEEERK